MDRSEILAALKGYFGDGIVKEIVQPSSGDDIVLYHNDVIPTVDQPNDIRTVYISPGGNKTIDDPNFVLDPDRQVCIPQVTRFRDAEFTVIFRRKRDICEEFKNPLTLLRILQRFYPYALTKDIIVKNITIAENLRINRVKRDNINRIKKQTQENILVGTNVLVTLINDVILRTNTNPSSDIGLFERQEFFKMLMETLKRVDIMNHPAVRYPNAK